MEADVMETDVPLLLLLLLPLLLPLLLLAAAAAGCYWLLQAGDCGG